MQTSATAVFPTASCPLAHSLRPRFTIRSDHGFLAACGGIGGPAVTTVADPAQAVHFVDFDTACTRAHLMTEVGWSNLRVVEVLIPCVL
jgi:hypothetical protein